MTTRRSMLLGLGAPLAAPAIVRANPARALQAEWIERGVRPPMVPLPASIVPASIAYVSREIYDVFRVNAA